MDVARQQGEREDRSWGGSTAEESQDAQSPDRRSSIIDAEQRQLNWAVVSAVGILCFAFAIFGIAIIVRGSGTDTSTSSDHPTQAPNFLFGRNIGAMGTRLEFSDAGLQGTIPTIIALRKEATYLNFQRNQITGTIPTELGLMTALTRLSLNDNLLTGELPSQLGLLTAMIYFEFTTNQLIGQLPTQLGRMTQLSYLGAGNNALTGTIPSEFGLIDTLTEVYLSPNSLTGMVPDSVCDLGRLRAMNIDRDKITCPADCGVQCYGPPYT